MSIKEAYENSKKFKRQDSNTAPNKVVREDSLKIHRSDLDAMKADISNILNKMKEMEAAVSALKSLDMSGFKESHKNMKEHHNILVSQHNDLKKDTEDIIKDLSSRLALIESAM